MSNLASIGSSLNAMQSGLDATTGDIAAQQVNGQKGRTSYFSAQVIAAGGSNIVGAVSQNTRQNVSVQGTLSASSQNTYFAINGDGFIPVVKPNSSGGQVYLSRVGTCVEDRSGNLVNENGYIVQGFALDENEKPVSGTLLSSLVNVNFQGLSGKALPTSSIALGLNLDSKQPIVTGAGQTFHFLNSDAYNSNLNPNDVIVPNGDNIGLGDILNIKAGNDQVGKNYTYTGVGSSFNIANGIFGKTSVGEAFNDGTAPATFGKAVPNDTLRVTVGANAAVDLTFVTSNPLPKNGLFNSLSSLSAALDKIPGLSSRVSNGVLYVASLDPTTNVTFINSGTGGTDFKSNIGLTDIIVDPTASNPFSTLGQLQAALATNPDVKAATTQISGSLSITASNPQAGITFTETAQRAKNAVNYIYAVQPDPTTAAGARALTSLTIRAPQNGLIAGDFVRLTGINTNGLFGFGANGTANGLYCVMNSDASGFTISASRTLAIGAVNAASTSAIPAGGTWQKVPGTIGSTGPLSGGVTIAGSGANPNVVTFANTGALAADVVNGAMVYIKGIGLDHGIIVPDGYYKVSAVAANTFAITVPVNGGGAVAAAGMTTNGSYTVVGTGAGNNTIDSSIGFTVSTTPGADPNTVRVMMPHNNYAIGDYFRVGGANIADDNNNVLNGGKTYKIINVDPNQQWFEFVASAAPANLIAGAGTSLPAANYIDRFGKFDKNISFNESLDGNLIPALYNPQNLQTSLASGAIANTFVQTVDVFDSQGVNHTLNLAFNKVNINQWAVEIYSAQNADGTYDVGDANGIISADVITFNPDGTVGDLGDLGDPITINWTNGTNPSTITINWSGTAAQSGGITQLAGGNNVSYIDPDGYAPGKLTSVSLNSAGIWMANFDNGQTLGVFKMPLLFVPAPDELTDLGGGVFEASEASGTVLVKFSGDQGVGNYIGNAVEGSNIDNTQKTVDLTTQASAYRYMTVAFGLTNDVERDFISRT